VFINLHNLPAGVHLYTLAITDAPFDTPRSELFYDEVDVLAPTRESSASALVRQMSAEDREAYAGQRCIGIVDQSVGRVIWENGNSVVRVPR
jgi:hypothetical protein